MTTTDSTAGSLIASMIPRWYSARLVIHWPGSADDSEESLREESAHSLTVCAGGGFSVAAII